MIKTREISSFFCSKVSYSAGNVKDSSVSRVVNSRLGTVVDTRDTVTERPEDKQIIVCTKK